MFSVYTVSFRFTYLMSSTCGTQIYLFIKTNGGRRRPCARLVLSFQREPQELPLKKRSHLGATSCLHHEATWHQDSLMLQKQIGASFV